MTTAARPTFNPAVGGTQRNEGNLAFHSTQYSSQDLPGHKKIKLRKPGQGTVEEAKERDFRQELEEREHRHRAAKRGDVETERDEDFPLGSPQKKIKAPPTSTVNLDADDPIDDSDERDSSEEEEEDDTAELMAELNRIKKEREAEQQKKDEVKKADDERIRMENILNGNPLLNKKPGDFTVKRRWDDDVVFKNCAKGQDVKTKPKNFINDSLRSEFHRKFMDKYIK